MPNKSAGVLPFRQTDAGVEVLLVHPGGPFWAKKDEGAWSIPKGEFADGEDPPAAARREFEEELGVPCDGELLPLETIRQAGGKLVFAWALRCDFDPAALKSNLFSMEWPPKSGRRQEFPEVDRASWFDVEAARRKIVKGQTPLLDRLLELLNF
jgi:predicted NUDIX family NTP pyrophosphohydrolase